MHRSAVRATWLRGHAPKDLTGYVIMPLIALAEDDSFADGGQKPKKNGLLTNNA